MDSEIFLVMMKNTILLWLLQLCFCVLMLKSVIFELRNNNNNDVKMDQPMTTYHGQFNFEP